MRAAAICTMVLVFVSGAVVAQGVDYTCVNRCTQQGYLYDLCTSKCSYGPAVRPVYPMPPAYPQMGTTFDLGRAVMQAEAIKQQREQLRVQQEYADAQRRLVEEQTKTQAMENQRREQEIRAATGSGSGPVPDPAMVAMFERWLGAVAPRMSRYPDFMSVATAADVMITPEMVQFMSSSAYAADIAYYLGTHKDEAAGISRMSVLDQAVAIKEIERRNQSDWSK